MMFFNNFQNHPLMKIARILKIPVLLTLSIGGIIMYNGWNTPTVDSTFEYHQFKTHERAERYLRDNYTSQQPVIDSLLNKGMAQYVFFEKGLIIGEAAPYNMTFYYEKSFPVDGGKVLWRAVDDRFELKLSECYVYQKDKKIYLKANGQLVFEPRPLIDLLKKSNMIKKGFESVDGVLSKPFEYDVQLSN